MKKVYVGPDEWHGSIFLTHGVSYEVKEMPRNKAKDKPFSISVRENGQVTSLMYKDKMQYQAYWR